MKKLLAVLFIFTSFQLTAQTLFYYGKDSVSVNDFLKLINEKEVDWKNGLESQQSHFTIQNDKFQSSLSDFTIG